MDIVNAIRSGSKVSWKDVYKSEKELVEDLKKIDIDKYKANTMLKGYVYIDSFKKQLDNNKTLTSKQLTQTKRLSKYIKLYHIELN